MAATTSGSVRRSEADGRALLAAFAESGLSQKAFCEREGVALSTFQYWKRRLGHRPLAESARTQEPASAASVIDLGTLEDRPAGWEVEIELGDGVSLTLRRR
jgi:hypothetical protein